MEKQVVVDIIRALAAEQGVKVARVVTPKEMVLTGDADDVNVLVDVKLEGTGKKDGLVRYFNEGGKLVHLQVPVGS